MELQRIGPRHPHVCMALGEEGEKGQRYFSIPVKELSEAKKNCYLIFGVVLGVGGFCILFFFC